MSFFPQTLGQFTIYLYNLKSIFLAFDLDSKIPSKLPKNILTMMKDIANVSLYVNSYKEIGMDYEAVPFGRIKREKVLMAKNILENLRSLSKQKGTIHKLLHLISQFI